MSSIRKLKMIAGAGEPDDVPAKRIDVIAAAERYYDATITKQPNYATIDDAEQGLYAAVRRYRVALKRRRREQAN